jgi:hypothetical protein
MALEQMQPDLADFGPNTIVLSKAKVAQLLFRFSPHLMALPAREVAQSFLLVISPNVPFHIHQHASLCIQYIVPSALHACHAQMLMLGKMMY